MENCGTCRHYVYNQVNGPSCSLNGKAVSYLMQKECYQPIEESPDVVTKVCNRCHRILPVSEFNRKSSTKDGYQFQCKECQAELARQLYQRRKDEQAKEPEPKAETKVCRQCGRELPVTMFGRAVKNHNGLKSYCRDCENANCRTYRAKRKAARQKAKAVKAPDPAPVQDVPVVNDLADMAIPVEELTFGKAIRQLLAYGSLTIKINLSKP